MCVKQLYNFTHHDRHNLIRLARIVDEAQEASQEAAQQLKSAQSAARESSAARLERKQSSTPKLANTNAASDAEPVPKVLDCGPLGGDCNNNQGGEFYSNSKVTEATGIKTITADAAMQEAETKLHATQAVVACDACMQLWTPGSLNCVVDKCPYVPHISAQSLAGTSLAQDGHNNAGDVLKTAMQGLDWRQLQLNNARAALFERFVGPDDSETASKVCERIFMCMCMCAYTHAFRCFTNMYTHAHTYIHTHTHIYIYIYIYIYTHTHTHTHILLYIPALA